jgi:hypothetical protein
MTPPRFDWKDDEPKTTLDHIHRVAVHRGLTKSALFLTDEYFKQPLDPHRKRNQHLTSVIALKVAEIYSTAYNLAYGIRDELIYTGRNEEQIETTLEQDVCIAVQRFANNQYYYGCKKLCKAIAEAVMLLEAVLALGNGGNYPSTGTIRMVAGEILGHMTTISIGPELRDALHSTYRIHRDNLNVGHVANFLIPCCGYVLKDLKYEVTIHNMLSAFMHEESVTDVSTQMVMIKGDLAGAWLKTHPVYYALFADGAVA